MKKVDYFDAYMQSSHANLGFAEDMAKLYTNSIVPDIASSNGCVLLTEDTLHSIIQAAFYEGWMCEGEVRDRDYGSVDDKYTNIPWREIESEFKRINHKKGIYFHNIAYHIPYCSKEYAKKRSGISEEAWNKLPKESREYFSQEYIKEDTFLGDDLDKWIKTPNSKNE